MGNKKESVREEARRRVLSPQTISLERRGLRSSLIVKKCAVCAKQFETRRKQAKFCCDSCRQSSLYVRMFRDKRVINIRGRRFILKEV